VSCGRRDACDALDCDLADAFYHWYVALRPKTDRIAIQRLADRKDPAAAEARRIELLLHAVALLYGRPVRGHHVIVRREPAPLDQELRARDYGALFVAYRRLIGLRASRRLAGA